MASFDWIVIGGGITGAALGYELLDQGAKVLLLERDPVLRGATRYSYGGIAHWAGTTELTRTLCQESLAIHRFLPRELDRPTHYRDLDLLLTIGQDEDAEAITQSFADCAVQPQILTPQEAQDREPQLHIANLQRVLRLPHAQIDAQCTAEAYHQAITRRGGQVTIAQVTAIHADRVETRAGDFHGANIVLCTGSESRRFLQDLGLEIPLYFSYAESVETIPGQSPLRTMVQSAVTQRFDLESQAAQPELTDRWQQPDQELSPPVIDMGALQFADGHIRMGQISRTLSNPRANFNPYQSEDWIRREVRQYLPTIADLPGAWCCCTVAFTRDHLPLIGALPEHPTLHLFSGFSNPMALVPALARRFAKSQLKTPDPLLEPLSPQRFLA